MTKEVCNMYRFRGFNLLIVAMNFRVVALLGFAVVVWGTNAQQQCSLCEDPNMVPDPTALLFFGQTCDSASITTVFDTTNLTSAECGVYQATFGVACKCDNPIATATKTCQLCGDGTILDPTALFEEQFCQACCGCYINAKGCVALEYEANLPGNDCAAYQANYTQSCCVGVSDSMAPVTSAPGDTLAPITTAPDAATPRPAVSPLIPTGPPMTGPPGDTFAPVTTMPDSAATTPGPTAKAPASSPTSVTSTAPAKASYVAASVVTTMTLILAYVE